MGPKTIGLLIALMMGWKNLGIGFKKYGFEKGERIYKVRKEFRIEPQLFEGSGMQIDAYGNFLIHTDSGGKPEVYVVNSEGNIVDTLKIHGAGNLDWEAMAADQNGYLYLADIGNNLNRRKDLSIYRTNGNTTDTIRISYKDQSAYPPPAERMDYDCEAIFWYEDHLWLISKNRGSEWVRAYSVPDESGDYALSPIDSIRIPHQITGADIDQETGVFLLVAYGAVYEFNWNEEHFFGSPGKAFKLSRTGQAEAIAMTDRNHSFILNESGKVFRVKRKK